MAAVSKPRAWRDIYAGLIFIVIASGFAIEATNYNLGTALRMGPGFMPLLLAGCLAAFGILMIVEGFARHEAPAEQPVAWRGIILICISLAIFGYGARQLGLVPVVALCAFLTAMASRNNSIISALTIAVCLSALCYVVFKIGLGITLPTIGPALSF